MFLVSSSETIHGMFCLDFAQPFATIIPSTAAAAGAAAAATPAPAAAAAVVVAAVVVATTTGSRMQVTTWQTSDS